MLHKAIQVRLYASTQNQQIQLAPTFGGAGWWWNYALNELIEVYKKTGKKLGCSALNTLLPGFKKLDRSAWLGECYSKFLPANTLNVTTAYKNFLEQRAGFYEFKFQHKKQSCQYTKNVKIVEVNVKLSRKLGRAKAKIKRLIEGKISTVIISKNSSGKSLTSILHEIEGENQTTKEGRIYGIDLGVKDFAIVTEGEKKSKYDNAKHFAKHEKNLKRQQQKLTPQQKKSNSSYKYTKVIPKVYERVKNSRQDFLHKLSYKLGSDSLAVIVENLHVLGRVCNQKWAKAIYDKGLGTFPNLGAQKWERKGGNLVEVDRWFPRSKLCSNCFHQRTEMPLDIREWTCPQCGTDHDWQGNAAINIRAEGIRILKTEGSAVSALGGEVRPKLGRKSKLLPSPMSTQPPTIFGTPI
ncbi:RNA-guided endonuclease InsQ/TnpB family protein [Microcoleus sp. OTE_8_concoct_300]|uniref:RNA-guided endonuclease InsQ/TnpB family protein n=1 Tax=Microcoleus sp. OTE_8_concoct_300 TaxID=2964710 RepID=UPI00403FB216